VTRNRNPVSGLAQPRAAKPRILTKRVRVTADELTAQLAIAKRQGQTWSAWAREAFGLAVARGSTR